MKDLIYKNIKHGLYEIDEFGNVYSKYKNGFLKPKRDKDGYLLLTLSGGKRGNSCFTRVATLVIVTYVGLPVKKHNLNEFLIGKTDWWYSPHYDRIMAMNTGKRPLPLNKKYPEINDWLWIMSTIDGNLVLDGKGGIGIEVE